MIGERARRFPRSSASSSIPLTGFRSIAPWLNVLTRLALIRTVLLLDERDTARELVQELVRTGADGFVRTQCSHLRS